RRAPRRRSRSIAVFGFRIADLGDAHGAPKIANPKPTIPSVRNPMWLAGAWAVFLKDVRMELRTRFALNALGLFVVAAVFLLRFALGDVAVTAPVAAGLLWVVILFAATVGLGRAFVVEEERGTVLLLQLTLRPSAVYGGKLLFNAALQLALNAVAAL